MRTGEGTWEWRTRTVWISLAALYTFWPLSFHTWGGRVATWGIAAFFGALCIIRPTRRNLPFTGAAFVSMGETALILDRLGIIRDVSARATNLETIGIGAPAVFFWIWHLRLRAGLASRH